MVQIKSVTIGPLVAEIFEFKNVRRHTARHTDRRRLDRYTISSPWAERWAKKLVKQEIKKQWPKQGGHVELVSCQLTQFLGKPPGGSLPVLCAHSLASGWQKPFFNQQDKENNPEILKFEDWLTDLKEYQSFQERLSYGHQLTLNTVWFNNALKHL